MEKKPDDDVKPDDTEKESEVKLTKEEVEALVSERLKSAKNSWHAEMRKQNEEKDKKQAEKTAEKEREKESFKEKLSREIAELKADKEKEKAEKEATRIKLETKTRKTAIEKALTIAGIVPEGVEVLTDSILAKHGKSIRVDSDTDSVLYKESDDDDGKEVSDFIEDFVKSNKSAQFFLTPVNTPQSKGAKGNTNTKPKNVNVVVTTEQNRNGTGAAIIRDAIKNGYTYTIE